MQDGNTTKFIAYPEAVVVDNATVTPCDPTFCEYYILDKGVEVTQCPLTMVAENKSQPFVLDPSLLEKVAGPREHSSYQDSGPFDEATMSEPTYRKLTAGYVEASTLSQAASSFFPHFQDGTGHVSSSVFKNVEAAAGNNWGSWGLAFGLLGGGILQQLLVIVGLYFIIVNLFRRAAGAVGHAVIEAVEQGGH